MELIQLRLRAMLVSSGQKASSENMYEMLESYIAKGVVTTASGETKVKSAGQISKLLRLVDAATAAGVYTLLKLGQ